MWPSLRKFLQIPVELTGKNIRIAIVDSEFPNHPDISTNERRTSYLVRTTLVPETPPDIFAAEPGPWTGSWHALCAAAAAGGSGGESGGLYAGVAPDADLFLVKGYPGEKECEGETAQIRALDWISSNWRKYEIRGVLSSLRSDIVSGIYPWQTDPRRILCEQLASQGLLVVAASGNRPDETSGISEAAAPSVLCVGGVVIPPDGNPNRAVMFQGNRGTTYEGKWTPEILAPAENVVLPRTSEEEIKDHNGGGLRDIPPLYDRTKGTSFAGPAVLGAAACLWQAHPGWTAEEMKSALIQSSLKKPEWSDLRAGLVSVSGAVAVVEPETAGVDATSPYQYWSTWKRKSVEQRLGCLSRANSDGVKDVILSFIGDDLQERATCAIGGYTSNPVAHVRAASLCALAGAPSFLVRSDYIFRAFRDTSPIVRMGGVYLLSYRSDLWSECRESLEDLFDDLNLDVRIGSLDLARRMACPEFAIRVSGGLEQDALNDRVANYGNRIEALQAITGKRLPFRLPSARGKTSDVHAVRVAKVDLARRWKNWLNENWDL